jgi:hypothetical protein
MFRQKAKRQYTSSRFYKKKCAVSASQNNNYGNEFLGKWQGVVSFLSETWKRLSPAIAIAGWVRRDRFDIAKTSKLNMTAIANLMKKAGDI